VGRVAAALLVTALADTQDSFRDPTLMVLAAGGAAALSLVGWLGRGQRAILPALFLGDLVWISLLVLGSGRPESGFTLFYAMVAFAAGTSLGGWLSVVFGLAAGVALVGSVVNIPGVRMETGWLVGQAGLVLVLGAVSARTRAYVLTRERALASASRALERMRLDTDSIVQNLTSAVLSVDRDGRVVHVNRAAEEILGVTAEEIRGREIADTLATGTRKLADVFARGLATGERVDRCEIEIERDGNRVPLGLGSTVFTGKDGNTAGMVVLFQDLSEVKRTEIVARRRDRLAAVGELAAGIAHEIRNSILPISGSVQMLSGELTLDAEQKKLFEVVEREMENVERFVSALLRYSRNDTLRPEWVDLRKVACEAVDDLRLSRTRGPHTVVEKGPVEVWADADQVKQAVRNVVLNAADAAGTEGRVMLRAGEDEDGHGWIEVEDDGPGIPPEERGRVLLPFVTGKAGGTGLGLSIVSRIMEDHEGEVHIAEGSLGGARIRLVFPSAPAATTATAA
jgi:PAS domain S-box-containing protein